MYLRVDVVLADNTRLFSTDCSRSLASGGIPTVVAPRGARVDATPAGVADVHAVAAGVRARALISSGEQDSNALSK